VEFKLHHISAHHVKTQLYRPCAREKNLGKSPLKILPCFRKSGIPTFKNENQNEAITFIEVFPKIVSSHIGPTYIGIRQYNNYRRQLESTCISIQFKERILHNFQYKTIPISIFDTIHLDILLSSIGSF